MFQHPSIASSAAHPTLPAIVKALTRPIALAPFALALFCLPATGLFAQTPTSVTVPTWRYDNTHSGANIDETALTPANVNGNTFGKLFSLKVDGELYAQPLYVPGLTMSDGQVHNVVFLATENDSIYAFDADSNTGANANPIWNVTLLDAAHGAGAGATAVPYQDTAWNGHGGSPNIAPTIGITGTPVIDPATNTMYVVAATKENGVYFSRLHAIDILTGAEQANSPVTITATVAGTGNGSSGGQLTFSPLWENQRPALGFYNGYVYIGYAAHGDYGPWHGWLFAYNATTLAQSAAICLSPNDHGSGIWSSGAGMPIDADAPGGRMFVVTGNGPYTPNVKFPFSGSTGYGMSVVDFSLADGGLTATDEFTAFNYAYLNTYDLDLASGGLLMLPDQQAEHPHILLAGGKEGRTLVLNRDDLGGYNSTFNNVLQDIPNQTPGYWGTPAYWNGHVYMWAVPPKKDASGNRVVGVPTMYQLSDGVMGTEPTSQSTITSTYAGASFSISSNGTQDGIAWALRSDQFSTHGPAVLYAWDANDLTNLFYESDTNSARDAAGPANRFSIPVVTNGKVYVATNGEVDVYGLFNGEANAVAPVIAPDGGTFTTSQSVTLTTTTASANIYYTLDGTVPTPSSTLYAGPISIAQTTTIRAIAVASGFVQSGVSSATFSFPGPPSVPGFSPAAGTYTTSQSVSLSDADANAKIYYTTDGSTPSASSNLYSSPIQVAVSETIKAIAIDPTLGSSTVASAAYIIQAASTGAFTLSATPTTPVVQGGSANSTITVTPSGGFTGSVALTCAITSGPSGATDSPTCAVIQPAAISGNDAVTATLTIHTQATTATGDYTATVTGSAGSGAVETAVVALTVTAPAPAPSFSLSVTPAAAIAPGGSATSTVTLTPSGGFTGSVAIACAVTGSPAGATDLPTCTASQAAAISGTDPVTSTLTVSTTAATAAALHDPLRRIFNLGGGGTLAALLFFCLPFRRRKWHNLLGLLVFFAIASAAIGCGGSHTLSGPTNSGTTLGNYTVTVTGTSGTTKASTTVTVTVQ